MVAKVNDYQINEKEYKQELIIQMKKEQLQEPSKDCKYKAIEQLIDGYLLLSEARKYDFEVSKEEVEEEMVELMMKYDSKDEFYKMLNSNKLDKETIKKRIKDKILIQKYIENTCKVNKIFPKEKLRSIYDENIELFHIKPKIRAYYILVRDNSNKGLEKIKQIDDQINSKEDFIDFVKNKADDLNCEAGDLGYFEKGKMIEEFEDAIFHLKINKISSPIKSPLGYHLAMVVDRKDGQIADFDKVKSILKKRLNRIETELKLIKHIKFLRNKADIKINENRL